MSKTRTAPYAITLLDSNRRIAPLTMEYRGTRTEAGVREFVARMIEVNGGDYIAAKVTKTRSCGEVVVDITI